MRKRGIAVGMALLGSLAAAPLPGTGTATVTVGVRQGTATEEGTGTLALAAFTLHRDGGDASQPLEVSFTLGGTATPGQDYQAIENTATIQTGESAVTVVIAAIDDAQAEGIETVVLTVQPGSGYSIGQPASQTVAIADNDGTVGIGVPGSR